MSYFAIRILIFLAIGLIVFLGIRRIWRDWRGEARRIDKAQRERDLRERGRPDVVTLKRGPDGTFRPPEEGG